MVLFVPIIVLLYVTIKQLFSNESRIIIKEAVTVVRDVKNAISLVEKVDEVSKEISNENVTTEENFSITNNNEPDSSEYFKYYTKEQLTEMKKICLRKSRSDGKEGYEHHAIDQAVSKWKGIPYREFMETFAKGKFHKDKSGIYRITKKWTIPLVEHSGSFRSTTIYETDKYLYLFE